MCVAWNSLLLAVIILGISSIILWIRGWDTVTAISQLYNRCHEYIDYGTTLSSEPSVLWPFVRRVIEGHLHQKQRSRGCYIRILRRAGRSRYTRSSSWLQFRFLWQALEWHFEMVIVLGYIRIGSEEINCMANGAYPHQNFLYQQAGQVTLMPSSPHLPPCREKSKSN